MPAAAHVRSFTWFATGVAMAVIATMSFTAWRADAVGSGESAFVPITPCRLLDTRPASQVGPRGAPLGVDEEYSVQVTGTEGECSLPAAATAVAVNLTGVGATAPTFVSIYPANVANPGTSALNMLPGQSPAPNKIDVQLSPDGKVTLFNAFGSVHIIGDVLGYYRSDSLTDLETRLAALESANIAGRIGAVETENATQHAEIDALEAGVSTLQAENAAQQAGIDALDAAQPFAISAYDTEESVAATDEVVASVEVTAPVAGHVTVNSTTQVRETTAGDGLDCSITPGTTVDSLNLQRWVSSGTGSGTSARLTATRGFEIAADATVTYNLVCAHFGTSPSTLADFSWLTAIFTPAP